MKQSEDAALELDSPVGRLFIVERGGAIVRVDWLDDGAGELGSHAPSPLLARARDQLMAYFAGDLRSFDVPLAPAGTEFQQRVWQVMRRIPYGETRSYGDLARALGGAPRAVGGACGRNPIAVIIPCHRVLARGRGAAALGGYSGTGGRETKRRLLALEGSWQSELFGPGRPACDG